MKRWPNSLAKEERYEKTIGSPSSRTTNKFYQQRTSKKELCRAIPPKNLFQILTFLLYSFLRYLMIAPLGKLPPLMHWRSGRSLSRRGTVEVVLQIYQYKVTSIDAQPYFIRTCFFPREFFCPISPPRASQCKVVRSPTWKGPSRGPTPPPSSSCSRSGPGGTDCFYLEIVS